MLQNGNLASGSWDTSIKIWNPNSGQLITTLYSQADAISSLAVLPNGNLVSGSWDSTIQIWDNDFTPKLTLNGHISSLDALLVVSADLLASASADGKIIFWNPNNGSLIKIINAHSNIAWTLGT